MHQACQITLGDLNANYTGINALLLFLLALPLTGTGPTHSTGVSKPGTRAGTATGGAQPPDPGTRAANRVLRRGLQGAASNGPLKGATESPRTATLDAV